VSAAVNLHGLTMTIAVIDDDEAVREATKALLRSLGYATSTFSSAEAFLVSQERQQVSCIISDIRMPGMSGIALQQHLVSEGYKIPFILITAFPEEGMERQALSAGALGFLRKPYDEQNLIDCIETAMKASGASDGE
jgi:FixJ family two-component response regulator